ncbi:TetR family transcriptional regulator [Novosphingobium sp. FSY-8]|uniref:TetR family transcriptional regulator n=1 Tax=Novosphingobium ovatum TaxID=1908523 RepID=A0ABW9X975_9SPHN|nr:TetR family transcriptional regulator [Novosphingobium ovatum]NBC35077.1 TetR family transcriptional regulator [Novosphingobium ovatum]
MPTADPCAPPDRRAAITDAAIAILGEGGSKALTHRAIDRLLGYAEGTTSAYFRRREDLVMATVRHLFAADFRRIDMLFAAWADKDDAPSPDDLAQWFADTLAQVRATQAESGRGDMGMLARYECFLMARRHPETNRLLRESFARRTGHTAQLFARMGAPHPDRAATQFEIALRGAFFSAAFVPDLMDEAGLLNAAHFRREIDAAMLA